MNYARSVHEVARDLVGATLRHGGTAGRIVEVESYHQEEPASHAYIGPRPRTEVLFGPPGYAYVYRSYGIHALVNAVAEDEGVGAAVLIRAIEPLQGIDLMHERRGVAREEDLTNGPGKLTEALGIGLEMDRAPLTEPPFELRGRDQGWRQVAVETGPRIGISRAAELPWRFCATGSEYLSRPLR
jgi:DNA-3-methyladenine glycosylase